jgi:hypothetical protein
VGADERFGGARTERKSEADSKTASFFPTEVWRFHMVQEGSKLLAKQQHSAREERSYEGFT